MKSLVISVLYSSVILAGSRINSGPSFLFDISKLQVIYEEKRRSLNEVCDDR